ncbi:MAG TPA: M48 family metallopeptidase [Burkholderiaceae bacterium]|nr:M48 family metallopeptidase [Burkholderiaceae bacterium]
MKVIKYVFAAALALAGAVPTLAQTTETGVPVKKPRLMLVPESMVNQSAAQQYVQLKQQAAAKQALNTDPALVQRVRAVALRLIPQGTRLNTKAGTWAWEVNVVDDAMINAFCMPGGKIMVFRGLIDTLQLNDDELAAVIGHEIAHALLEHGRARVSEQVLKSIGINLAAAYFGLSDVGTTVLAQAAQLAVTLPYSRGHEIDADLVGLELAARAGYDPRAAVSVWKKMSQAGGSQPPQFLSTHPGHAGRIKQIEANLPRVLPLYERSSVERPRSSVNAGLLSRPTLDAKR